MRGSAKLLILKALLELLKVKSITTLAIIGTMSFMSIKGAIDPATFMTIAGSVVTYYFTRPDKRP